MKKIVLSVTLLFSIVTFAQKEELKTLKKVYAKEKPFQKDVDAFKTALQTLEVSASTEEDKVYKNFYKGMLPLVELASLGEKATPADQLKMFTPANLDNLVVAITETLEFEKKSGKKVYTDDINETMTWLKPMLSQFAFQFNSNNQFKESSNLFYKIYQLDKSDGVFLENAANLAIQAKDYTLAEKLYEELKNSDYLNKGVLYFAKNKATGQEEMMPDKATRMKMISLGTHEKPREEKMSDKKPEVFKTVALLAAQNGNVEKAIAAFNDARNLTPNDENLKQEEALLYYNIGYLELADDEKIVDEINKNLNDKAKYDASVTKRKEMFSKALPHFEKAYQINPSDQAIIQALRLTYDVLGMKEKADKL
jgi:hypothetical protein